MRTSRNNEKAGNPEVIGHDEAITHLQVMHTWASFAIEENMPEVFDLTALKKVEQWTDEIIRMLQAEEDDGK